ncbi:class I SAM-dependent methyltransferase [Rhodosalinus halophilus]|uniref:Class I SAM-dependent methyltransferase n=1 Tax=Rhodosalinus halophilus TaxID=2259333 RepID=A0A365UAY2_9RHOB|nr:class I SAM-dependent methyltransferase [Rhodosalinus halophilus]RBI86309.1 class I SAM-dependent methyltransferase [Rhodosalinus halophilus]
MSGAEEGAPPARRTPLDLLHDWAVRDSFETFRDRMARAMLFPKKADLRRWACARARERHGAGGLYAEFGVWRGHGVNLFARVLKGTGVTVWGFDSFEGLEEDWTGHPRGGQAGRFSTGGALPEVRPNVRLVKGRVQDTVPGWLAEREGPVAFAHLDLDTYTPTRFVLEALRPRLVTGSVLVFDELYGYPGWREHEYRALVEVLGEEGCDFLAFSEQAVALEIAEPR